jgi:hypothetical protein
VRTQPGLDVGESASQLRPQLGRDERTRKRAVHIPDDNYPSWLAIHEDWLESFHNARGLNGVRARSDVQKAIRLGDAEIT